MAIVPYVHFVPTEIRFPKMLGLASKEKSQEDLRFRLQYQFTYLQYKKETTFCNNTLSILIAKCFPNFQGAAWVCGYIKKIPNS